MCGRFTQYYTWSEIQAFLGVLGPAKNLRARYNIAPTTIVDVVRPGEQGRDLVGMRWGLVPAWWKKPLRDLPATFNARAEGLASKPMFREALKRRRCVIPASGFFEWTGQKGNKIPHFFSAADGSPILAFAGLWDRWRDPASEEEILSCTIVVSGASAWMAPYHDRMPVLLGADDIERWLNGSLDHDVFGSNRSKDIVIDSNQIEHDVVRKPVPTFRHHALAPEGLRPAAESALREWVVSSRVNRTGAGDDDAATVAPVSDAGQALPL